MKIARNKKLKNLIKSKKNLKFGDKMRICFACGAIVTEKNQVLCPYCRTNLINKKKNNIKLPNKKEVLKK
jgi:uncharacterized paraquat-inducible protein A